MTEHVDVLIVGAGLSGIGAAVHLAKDCPDRSVVILEGPRRDRRDVGPVPLPRHPLGQRHVHPRLQVQTVDGGEVDRRRPVDPRLCPRDRRRARRRTPYPLRPQGDRRVVVDRRRPLDRHRRARRRVDRRAHVQLPLHVQRLLQLRRGAPPRLSRRGRVRRTHRPPAVLARRPRLCRPPSGGHRQRRDGGHARPRDGEDGGARDDAAAVADLCRQPPGQRRGRRHLAPVPAGEARVQPDPVQECRDGDVFLPDDAQAAGQGPRPADRRRHPGARPRLRRRDAFQSALQSVGPAAVPRPRRRPVRRDQGRERVGRHRHDRNLHPHRHPPRIGRGDRRRCRRRGDWAQADRARRDDGQCRRAHDQPRRLHRVQGDDVLERPQPRAVARLYQRVVDPCDRT